MQDQGEYWLTGRQDKPARWWEERAEWGWEVMAKVLMDWVRTGQGRTGQDGQQWC